MFCYYLCGNVKRVVRPFSRTLQSESSLSTTIFFSEYRDYSFPLSFSINNRLFTGLANKIDNFVVSILGPPNAGKTTLFNRLQCKKHNRSYELGCSKRSKRGGKEGTKGRISSLYTSDGGAIVSSTAGTTRDRRECWGRIGSAEFRLMDTAGIDGDRIRLLSSSNRSKSEKHKLERQMMDQTMEAARQCDLVLLLWDAKVGMTQDLLITARWLRRLGKISNVVPIANKLEGDSWAQDEESVVMENLHEISRLELGNAIPISALHGDGMADIAILIEQRKKQKIAKSYKEARNGDDISYAFAVNESKVKKNKKQNTLQIAIIGRPNVGKSTLLNRLLNSDRVLTGPTPGITRDAITVEWNWNDLIVQLVDTAGIRKFSKRMYDTIEDQSVADAIRAIKTAEVAVLVLDAQELYIQKQELLICNTVLNEGRSLVIAANKIDLLEMSKELCHLDFSNAVRDQIEARIPILRNIPVVPMSCLSGYGVSNILPVSLDARNRWARMISTSTLNRWLIEIQTRLPPPYVAGVQAKLKYIIQTKGRPPTFIIFTNVKSLPVAYTKYLTKQFQDSFEFYGIPIRLILKPQSISPFHNKKKRGGFGLGGREARFRRRIEGQRLKPTKRYKGA